MEIVYSFNKTYINQTKVSVLSVLEHNSDIKFLFLCFGVKEHYRSFLSFVDGLNVSFQFELIDHVMDDLGLRDGGRHIRSVYSKLLIPQISTEDVSFYLDSDTLVRGKLDDIFLSFKDSEKIFGLAPVETDSLLEFYQIKSRFWYNDGVALINNNLFNEFKGLTKFMDEFKKQGYAIPYLSEGLINKVFEGKIYCIPIKYNMVSGYIRIVKLKLKNRPVRKYFNIEQELKDVRVLHYIGSFYNRPWFYPCTHPFKKQYRWYMNKLGWKATFKPLSLRLYIASIYSMILRK